ncbi:MAG: hypothetical protein U0Q15_07870 [Kineosporiaceae bacterium]
MSDAATPAARSRVEGPSPAGPLRAGAAVLALLTALGLSACSDPGTRPPETPITAGGSDCELPELNADPTTVAPGAQVRLTGKWFVIGCAGQPGLEPKVSMGASLIDSAGTGHTLGAVDAEGSDGTIDLTVTIPADVPEGQSRIIVGPSGPVQVMVKR